MSRNRHDAKAEQQELRKVKHNVTPETNIAPEVRRPGKKARNGFMFTENGHLPN